MSKKDEKLIEMITESHNDLIVTMQAALIEWKHGAGAEAALQWIVNKLDGPGLLPSSDEPWGTDAQAYMSANRSDPFPLCQCGRPSHIAWMERGFCSQEHLEKAQSEG